MDAGLGWVLYLLGSFGNGSSGHKSPLLIKQSPSLHVTPGDYSGLKTDLLFNNVAFNYYSLKSWITARNSLEVKLEPYYKGNYK